jgi:LysM repeat protein
MTKQICTWLSLLTLLPALLFALPVFAQEQEQTYIIKKGDTLWGISERFINDPYYWPNLWANNPGITNPHLIYPGQELRIYDGRLIVVPVYPAPEPATAEAAPQQPPPAEVAGELPTPRPSSVFKTAGGGEGFILAEENPLGIIIDSVDDRTLLTENDTVFLKMRDPSIVSVGDIYSILKRGERVVHPASKRDFGNMMHNLGFLQVTGIGTGYVTAKIGKVFREVERGAELYRYLPPVMEISLKKTASDLLGSIVATQSEKLTQGQQDVVFIDLGLEDGLEVGNMLYITRPRSATELGLQQADTPLPDDLLGAAVVIESRAETAAALIIKSVKTIYLGDRVMSITD